MMQYKHFLGDHVCIQEDSVILDFQVAVQRLMIYWASRAISIKPSTSVPRTLHTQASPHLPL